MGNQTEGESKDRMAALEDSWLSVKQAAVHASVCEKTIRRAYLSRQMKYTRVGRAVRFRRGWVDEWLLQIAGSECCVAVVDRQSSSVLASGQGSLLRSAPHRGFDPETGFAQTVPANIDGGARICKCHGLHKGMA